MMHLQAELRTFKNLTEWQEVVISIHDFYGVFGPDLHGYLCAYNKNHDLIATFDVEHSIGMIWME